ncbi:hypothetical protein C8R45DRAFT_1150300 [Mycena sanguinolenta]|nr:hypothetical protein C8R45DRAFT_1150300 [Mycena sanguinolenta]
MDPDCSPFFPPELEQEIFQMAAYFHPAARYNLSLVCWRVYDWIDGMQYTTVMSHDAGGSYPAHILLRDIHSDSKSPSFFQSRVQNLYLAWGRLGDSGVWGKNTDALRQVLSACSGVQNLVLLLLNSHSLESLLPTLPAIKPRRLALLREPFFDPRTPIAMFTSLTHLHILSDPLSGENQTSRLPAFLVRLPTLTHFAMGVAFFRNPTTALAKDILEMSITLQVLILVGPADVKPFLAIYDPRIVVHQRARQDDFVRGWVAETRGGIDFWARAEAFVAKKRRGEIQPTSRCWIEVRDGIADNPLGELV